MTRQGRHKEAEPRYREGLEISRRVNSPDHPDTLRWTNNLACSAALRGDRAAAIGYLREPVEGGWATRQKLEEDEDLASLRGEPEFKALLARATTPG